MTATSASVTTLNALFKTQYINTLMQQSVADKIARPLTALLRDAGSIEKNSFGRGASYPVIYERPSTSATFTTAQTNGSPVTPAEFNPTVIGHLFSPFQITTDAIYRAMGDKAAFMGMVEFAVAQHTAAVADDLEQALFASGAGELATTVNTTTGTTVQLTAGEDVWKFKVGDELVFGSDLGVAVQSGSVAVTAISFDGDDGYLTVESIASNIGGGAIEDGYYVFRSGSSAGASTNPLPTGLLAYATSNTSLHGLNNSTHYRLMIPTVTGDLTDPVAAIQEAQMLLQKIGPLGKASAVFVPWNVWVTISQQVDSDNRDKAGGLGEKGYNALRIVGPQGPMDVLGSKYVQANTCWLVDPKTFKLCHVGPQLVDLEKASGQVLKVRDALDAVEGRVAARCQLLCLVPAANARITLS